MAGFPKCPKCGKNDKIEILGHNKITTVTRWYCYRCRTEFKTGGRKG